MLIDAAQITTPHRDAVPIEKFEDMDGHLAAAGGTVTKLTGEELSAWRRCCELADNLYDFRQCAAQEEMVVGDLVHLPHAGGLLIACAPNSAAALVEKIIADGYPSARLMGHVASGPPSIKVHA